MNEVLDCEAAASILIRVVVTGWTCTTHKIGSGHEQSGRCVFPGTEPHMEGQLVSYQCLLCNDRAVLCGANHHADASGIL
jgi:hypothetical protein